LEDPGDFAAFGVLVFGVLAFGVLAFGLLAFGFSSKADSIVSPEIFVLTQAADEAASAEYTICEAVIIGRPVQIVSPMAQTVWILDLGTPDIARPSMGSPKRTCFDVSLSFLAQ